MNAPRIPPRLSSAAPVPATGEAALRRARLVLWVSRVIHAYWPFSLVAKLYLTCALFGLFAPLGPLAHTLLLLTFLSAAMLSLRWGWQHYRAVTPAEARRAVEKASGLAHRPLTALADTTSIPNPLWGQHITRMAGRVAQVRLSLPGLPRELPLVRGVALASWGVLLLAVVFAGHDIPRRLEQAASPKVAQLLPVSRLDGWITPPAYTGEPPQALLATQPQLSVTAGGLLTLRINGGWFAPVVELPQGRVHMQAQADGTYLLETVLNEAGRIRVRQDGAYIGDWRVTLLIDSHPLVSFTEPPAATEQAALRLSFAAGDDLGLAKVWASIELVKQPAANKLPAIELPFATSPKAREAHGFRYFDLSAHPLAGQDVHITLHATDVKGQEGSSEPVLMKLPERRFNNAISKALIALRREMTLRGWGSVRMQGILVLEDLQQQAATDYPQDWLGQLSLSVLEARIKFNAEPDVMASAQQLMWDTALHFEDGGSGDALNQLRRAQQALEDALANNASDAEIAQLMNELEQAMQNYLQHLAQQPPSGSADDMAGRHIETKDLQNMMDAIRNMAQSGARDQARQLLNQLQNMMENLQSGGQSGSNSAMQQTLEKLEGIARQQGELMQRQYNPQPGRGQPSPQEQEALQQELGDAMQELQEQGHEAGQLEGSAQSMGRAGQAMRDKNGRRALDEQGEALTQLQEGIGQLREEMAKQQGQSGDQDPLGRGNGQQGSNTSKVEIPDRDQADRARRLLEELRNRASDPNRPSEEKQYLERLLKWF